MSPTRREGAASRNPDERAASRSPDERAASPPPAWPLADHPAAELRELSEDDAAELHAVIDRNRERLARWLVWARDQGPEGTREFIRQARCRAAASEGLERAIVVEGRIAGMAGFPVVDWGNRRAEIGYWLDEAHQGCGLVTAAVARLVDHAFDGWRLNRLEIRTDVENVRSRAVAERLGFRFEGVLRKHYWVGDRYSDDAVYSLLAEDRHRPDARLTSGR